MYMRTISLVCSFNYSLNYFIFVNLVLSVYMLKAIIIRHENGGFVHCAAVVWGNTEKFSFESLTDDLFFLLRRYSQIHHTHCFHKFLFRNTVFAVFYTTGHHQSLLLMVYSTCLKKNIGDQNT